MVNYRSIRLLILALCVILTALELSRELHAQQSDPLSVGLQVQLQRDASGSGFPAPDYLFGAYLHHGITSYISGELGLSIGTLSGRDFKSRRIPVEYRFNARLDAIFSHLPVHISTTPFLYTGLGWMFHQPVEIPSDMDPLTPTQGSSVGSSSLWKYESGISPFLPIGAGASHQLSTAAFLDVRFGYHVPLEIEEISRGARLERGYWGLSIGLRFRSQRPEKPTVISFPPPAVRIPEPELIMEPIVKRAEPVREFPYEEVERLRIHFELNSSRLDRDATYQVTWLASQLKEHSDVAVVVSGHTDTVGTNQINEFLSWSRARSVWLLLVDSGVDPDRIVYRGLADRKPLKRNAENGESELNRRVSFRTTTLAEVSGMESDLVRPAVEPAVMGTYMPGEPLFGRHVLSFGHFSTTPRLQTMEYLTGALRLLNEQPGLHLLVLARDDSYSREVYREEVSVARAEWIRAWLIHQGVNPSRITAVGRSNSEDVDLEWVRGFREDRSQQMLLIPVRE